MSYNCEQVLLSGQRSYASYIMDQQATNSQQTTIPQQTNPQHHANHQDLFAAASLGDVKLVQSLVSKSQSQVNSTNDSGWTALMYAAHYGHYNVIKILLDFGAEPDMAEFFSGRTALMLAASNGHTRCIETLVGTGNADILTADHQGNTAAYYATHYGHGSNKIIAKLLGIRNSATGPQQQQQQQQQQQHNSNHHNGHRAMSSNRISSQRCSQARAIIKSRMVAANAQQPQQQQQQQRLDSVANPMIVVTSSSENKENMQQRFGVLSGTTNYNIKNKQQQQQFAGRNLTNGHNTDDHLILSSMAQLESAVNQLSCAGTGQNITTPIVSPEADVAKARKRRLLLDSNQSSAGNSDTSISPRTTQLMADSFANSGSGSGSGSASFDGHSTSSSLPETGYSSSSGSQSPLQLPATLDELLEAINLTQYSQLFRNNRIGLYIFLTLCESDLCALGISDSSHRNLLMATQYHFRESIEATSVQQLYYVAWIGVQMEQLRAENEHLKGECEMLKLEVETMKASRIVAADCAGHWN